MHIPFLWPQWRQQNLNVHTHIYLHDDKHCHRTVNCHFLHTYVLLPVCIFIVVGFTSLRPHVLGLSFVIFSRIYFQFEFNSYIPLSPFQTQFSLSFTYHIHIYYIYYTALHCSWLNQNILIILFFVAVFQTTNSIVFQYGKCENLILSIFIGQEVNILKVGVVHISGFGHYIFVIWQLTTLS